MNHSTKACWQTAWFVALLLALSSLGSAASRLTITPANPRQLSNSTLQFRALINGELVDGPVTWSSSNPVVATITARSGRAQATLLSAGTTTITAVHGEQRASTGLTVTVAAAPVFTSQPRNTNVSAVINPGGGVKVKLVDNLGNPLPGQSIVMSIATNPPGTGTLTGRLTQRTDAGGTARFTDLKIDWLGTGYTLLAGATPSSGPVSGTSTAFNELRVGNICLGPDTPACQGTCRDRDGDGLNDAWEVAGGVDINGDGLITDSAHDLLLPAADPNKPDIYVLYDWMDYGPPGNACTVDSDCSGLGFGHQGETCTGPQLIPSAPASCRYACNLDADCTARGASHAEELCQSNSCVHTHDPSVTAPNALQAVVDRFAAHGINLHLMRGKAQPHSTVLSFRLLSDPDFPTNVMSDTCEGGSLASGDAGIGKYAESLYDLKANSSPDKLNIAYHYTIFSHYSGCDTAAHCHSGTCLQSLNPDGSPKAEIVAGESGLAEISGNDFIVSLGNRVVDLGFADNTLSEGGTFMHELGHNLGLHHGGGIEEPCQDQSQCHVGYTCQDVGQPPIGRFCVGADDTTYKPNYLTVMNYRFQFVGIEPAVYVGSSQPISCSADTDCPSGNYCVVPPVGSGVCSRLDYSNQTLPTGGNTPGALDESNSDGHLGLNEPAGLGSGTADLTSYFQYDGSECIFPAVTAPTDGPLDFDGDGDTTDTSVIADLNGVDHQCGTLFARLTGATDWPELSGLNFTYSFQCTAFGGPGGDGPQLRDANRAPSSNLTGGELSPQMAMDAHMLFPPFSAKIIIRPGCSDPSVALEQTGTIQVALLGDRTFDVTQVDLSSLKFAGVPPSDSTVSDVNADGIPDLLLSFDMAKLKLSPHATRAHLSGWLKNSQAFSGNGEIRVVPSLTGETLSCR